MKLRDYTLITPTASKAVSLSQFNDERLWTEVAPEGRRTRNKERDINVAMRYRDTIGVIYRCVDVRAAMLSALPWTILKDNKVFIDSETAWEEDNYLWLENLPSFLSLTESSLLLSSEAFWLKERSLLGTSTGIRWLAAPYIKPLYSESDGIVGFERSYGNNKEQFSPEDIAYFWVQNPMTELTPDIPQVLAAANSADVILNYEEFVRAFYERGAVKATILKVDRSTPPKERTRLREFWQDFMAGNKNAHATEVVSGDVEAEVIGEGAGDSEKTEVLVSRRKDIATAMGVPYSLLFGDTSSSYTAGPTEERNFLNYTIIPRAKLVQRVLNAQVFREEGLYFRFNFNALPAFKESGEMVSKTFTTYVNSLIPHSVAAQIAGVPMPEGVTYEDLDKAVEAERERQFKEKERIVSLNSKLVGGQPGDKQGGKPGEGQPKAKAPSAAASDNNLKHEDERRLRKWLKNRSDDAIVDVGEFDSEHLTDSEKLDVYVRFLAERGGSEDTLPFGQGDVSRKSLVTYGSSDETEVEGLRDAELLVRKDLDAVFVAQLSGAMALSETASDEEFVANLDAWVMQDADGLQSMLIKALVGYAALGIAGALLNVHRFIPGYTNENAELAARAYATQRAMEATRVIQATTQKRIAGILAEWKLTTLPRAWVFEQLRGVLSEERAALIAETESIDVATRAALIIYESTRLVRIVRFTAAMDERTCPVCGRMHGNLYTIGNAPKIPVHPRCRCTYRSVVDTTELRYFYEMTGQP